MRKYFWADGDISLRIINKKDVNDIYKSLRDTKFRMDIDHGVILPANMNKAEEIINDAIASTKEGEEIYFSILNNEGIMVGYTLLSWIDERLGILDCNVFIFSEYRRRGYGTTAYNIMLDYVFNERRIHKVHCCTIDGNNEGPAFLYKFGFKFEAKRSEMFYSHGKYLSEYYYGLTEDEYRNNKLCNRSFKDCPKDLITKIPYSTLGEIKNSHNNKEEFEAYEDRKYFWDYGDISVRATRIEDYMINEEMIKDSKICRFYDDDVKLPMAIDEESVNEKLGSHLNFKCEDGRLEFSITDKDGNYIGNVSLCGLDYKNGKFSLSIYMVPECRGKGYGTKALRLIVSYAFFELRMNKLITNVNDGNEASATMMRKVGCKVEGVRRECAYYTGKYVDVVFFGITKKEFAEFNKGKGVGPFN